MNKLGQFISDPGQVYPDLVCYSFYWSILDGIGRQFFTTHTLTVMVAGKNKIVTNFNELKHTHNFCSFVLEFDNLMAVIK